MARIRPVRHEDRLTLVEHLDELRTRLLISVVVFFVAWGLCFWQSDLVLDIFNRPLPDGTEPLTLSPTEPFFTTLTTAAYAALMLALPLVLYQLYAFVLPAFSARERRAVFPLLLLIPFLFAGGVAFGYFVVLDRAVDFLLNFNEDQFNIEIRAREYYSFVALALVALGFLFQIPVVILGMTRLGITTPQSLRRSRRWAILAIAVVAMLASPGGDPMTMLILMIPLIVLYELSIVLAAVFGRPPEEPVTTQPAHEGPGPA
jgi:sec-independent protein translocase protein TatC